MSKVETRMNQSLACQGWTQERRCKFPLAWRMHRVFEREARYSSVSGVSARFDFKEATMLWTIAVVLLVLWALGLVSSYTMGGFIHILLVVAIVMVLVNLISGRRASV